MLTVSDPGAFACLRSTPGETVLVLVNLTASILRDMKLSLGSSRLKPGTYQPTSLLGDASPGALSALENGRIQAYTPVPEIPPYGTLILLVQTQ